MSRAMDQRPLEWQIERRRLLQQRGIVLTGTSTVTAALALQSLGFLFQQTVALVGIIRWTAVSAILFFAGAAILALFAVREGGQFNTSETSMANANDADAKKVIWAAVLEVIGIALLALTAIFFVL